MILGSQRLSISLYSVILLFGGCQEFQSTNQRILQIENGLLTSWKDPFWRRMKLSERMRHYNVPGVSIAVINNFQLEWAKGYGVLQAGSNDPVTPSTLFQTGSIGKPVVAAAALHFVQTGKLDLDENVNRKLSSWQIPANSFTARSDVTLRRLLSHTAGVTLPGVIGYAQGETLPTLHQMLGGDPPANTPPIHVDRVPGTQFHYSGGGYLIVEQLLVDLSGPGKTFPEIIHEVIFQPCGMTVSVFDPLPEELWDHAAAGHRAEGSPIPGGWFVYPEMGMGPFWTTPTDMARFVIETMLAYNGRSDQILSRNMVRTMLSPQIGTQGLGFGLGDDGADRFYFFHKGANEGYRTMLIAYPKRGQGAIIMTNSDNGDLLVEEIVKSLSVTYGWVSGIRL